MTDPNWDEVARNYASTPEGRTVLEQAADQAAATGTPDTEARLRIALTRGQTLRDTNKAIAQLRRAPTSHSPTEYGFRLVTREEWVESQDRVTRRSTRVIPTNSVIHTGQERMYPDRVKHFIDHPDDPDSEDQDLPDVNYVDGRLYMGEGHHRLAAARARGEQSIIVDYYEADHEADEPEEDRA